MTPNIKKFIEALAKLVAKCSPEVELSQGGMIVFKEFSRCPVAFYLKKNNHRMVNREGLRDLFGIDEAEAWTIMSSADNLKWEPGVIDLEVREALLKACRLKG